jgi:hypothetical protein
MLSSAGGSAKGGGGKAFQAPSSLQFFQALIQNPRHLVIIKSVTGTKIPE